MLTARVCQLYPNAAPSTLLSRFFSTWGQWKFGEASLPVLLTSADANGTRRALVSSDECTCWEGPKQRGATSFLTLRALVAGDVELPAHSAALDWNPQSARDRNYVMIVITPCRPRICATHAVCKSTLAVVKAELARAASLVATVTQQVIPAAGRASDPTADFWPHLFEPIDFFGGYKGFVVVQLTADDAEQNLHWCGWVKSRLRRLVLALERLPSLEAVHPLPWPLKVPATAAEGQVDQWPTGGVTAESSLSFFIGVAFARSGGRNVDLRPAAAEFVNLVNSWESKLQLCPSAQLQVRLTRKSELPPELLRGSSALPFADEQDLVAVCGSDGGAAARDEG